MKHLNSSILSFTSILFSLNSMQQGKMFFFIGVIMALIQGGYARRIKPGQHIKAVRMVGLPSVYMTNRLYIENSLCLGDVMHHCTNVFFIHEICRYRKLLKSTELSFLKRNVLN